MALEFEWHPVKAEANQKDHGVSFEEASTVFRDPLGRLVDDLSMRCALCSSAAHRPVVCSR